MNKIENLKTLIDQLNQYRDEYYNQSNPSISDEEYDRLFDELTALENETGIYLSNSPTQSVGYEVKSKLNKVVHNHPMLSLGKTKDINEIVKFFRHHAGVAMLKMDGLTCSVGYKKDLVSAESRGNGEIGEDLLHNAKVVTNLPLRINHDDLIVDGEMIIDYHTFEKINEIMPEGSKFKNPRNLCSGSIRQLDSKIAAERGIKFVAWKCIKGIDDNDFAYRLRTLKEYGFEVVPFVTIQENPTVAEVEIAIEMLKEEAKKNRYPIDGIVFGYRDVVYGESLGMTSHHLNSQIAFKFANDVEYTTLNGIEWAVGRTGQITPIGLLETVNILDTDVSRVSLHNLKVIEDLNIKIGSTVGIIKSNEIIPMCVECDGNGNDVVIPTVCPECGYPTEVVSTGDSKVLMCNNLDCKGKFLNKLINFCSRNAMNIDGCSEATLEVLLDKNYVTSFIDLYHLDKYKVELSSLPGFGAKSISKLLKSIDDSRKVDLTHLITAMGINLIGKSTSKLISKHCNGDVGVFSFILENTSLEFAGINGVGVAATTSLDDWWQSNREMFYLLLEELEVEVPNENHGMEMVKSTEWVDLNSQTFCITGKLTHFANRDAMIESILAHGGQYLSGVSSKLNYLVNNDKTSTSGKNKKALDLGIEIISEADYLQMIGEN